MPYTQVKRTIVRMCAHKCTYNFYQILDPCHLAIGKAYFNLCRVQYENEQFHEGVMAPKT